MAKTGYAISTAGGSWTQPIIDMLEATLFSHPAWSKVATVNSPGGMPCSVWKCSGETNSWGTDWYFLIARVTTNPSQFYIAVAEGFNPETGKVIRPAPGTAQNQVPPGADFSYGNGAEYSIWNQPTGSTLNNVDISWHTQGQGAMVQAYGVVSKDWVALVAHATPTGVQLMWVGCVETFANPLEKTLVSTWGNYGGNAASMTRHYRQPQRHGNNWRATGPSNPWTPISGTVNGAGDRLFGNLPVGSRVVLSVGLSENVDDYKCGKLVGLYPDMYKFMASGDMTYGDTVTVGGQKYLYCGSSAGMVNADAP